jgi:hypothetical protein
MVAIRCIEAAQYYSQFIYGEFENPDPKSDDMVYGPILVSSGYQELTNDIFGSSYRLYLSEDTFDLYITEIEFDTYMGMGGESGTIIYEDRISGNWTISGTKVVFDDVMEATGLTYNKKETLRITFLKDIHMKGLSGTSDIANVQPFYIDDRLKYERKITYPKDYTNE